MITITANDLKKRGVSALMSGEVLVSVRGEVRYVVLDVAHYESLREAELEMAIAQAKQEVLEGKFVIESVAEHMKRVTK